MASMASSLSESKYQISPLAVAASRGELKPELMPPATAPLPLLLAAEVDCFRLVLVPPWSAPLLSAAMEIIRTIR